MMPDPVDYKAMALALFEDLCRQFNFSYERDDDAPAAVCIFVPKQEGLHFNLTLMLQDPDALFMCVEQFTMSYFPCGKEGAVKTFTDDIVALLSGRARIIEYRMKGVCFKSLFQVLDGTDWKDRYRYSKRGMASFGAKIFPVAVKQHMICNY